MRYPDNLLAADEKVVFDVHHHFSVLWKPIALFLAFLLVWVVVLSLLSSGNWVILIGLLVLLAMSLYFAWRVQVWTHTNLVLTDQRLIYQTGVITRHSRELPLSRINDVSCYQMVLGRVFGMGDLIVESGGEAGPFAYFSMPDPERLKMRILERVKAAHAGVTGPADIEKHVAMAVEKHQPTSEFVQIPAERPPMYSEIVDQIERLDQLRARGVLTPEEFQEAKEALLGKLSREKDQ
jgi:uncharacterized membrane protein YdbT with pleckstrin-like domain